jgi:glucoamylase
MVLAASEDKTHRGAYVASPSAPWAFGRDDPSGPYHLVWSRDLYQIGSGLIAAGDTAGANRAVDYLFAVQQKPDGSFPQNSRVDGTPVWVVCSSTRWPSRSSWHINSVVSTRERGRG